MTQVSTAVKDPGAAAGVGQGEVPAVDQAVSNKAI